MRIIIICIIEFIFSYTTPFSPSRHIMLFTPSAPSLAGSHFAFASEQETSSRQRSSHTDADAPPLPSESLLRGHKIVEIVHNGNLYKLQATKLGKLILTK
jgi:hemin uptake protein HemP